MLRVHDIVLSGSSSEVQTGLSYIRWGRKTCEGNASLVYTGNIYKQKMYHYCTCYRPIVMLHAERSAIGMLLSSVCLSVTKYCDARA